MIIHHKTLMASAAVAVLLFTFFPGSANAYLAKNMLKDIQVSAESSDNNYSREAFPHWLSLGASGCNTRVDVLIDEGKRVKKSGCAVKRGIWKSVYDKKVFVKPGGLDIDHFVPLAQAYRSGASKWDEETRRAYANDQGYAGSLIAVSATSNRSKSDKDPARWMPPSKTYACKYVATWIAVKWRWSLTADQPEYDKLASTVKKCGSRASVAKPRKATVGSGSDLETEPAPPSTGTGGNDPRYSTCTQAKAAGYGPYYKGTDPEYDWYRDADNDGVVCE